MIEIFVVREVMSTVASKQQFETVFVTTGPLSRPAVQAIFCRLHNRKENPEVDRVAVDETWEALVSQNSGSVFYNGLKFRLHRAVFDGDQCRFELGLTDYKTSVGTTRHISAYAGLLTNGGATQLEDHLANALGVECFVTTKDGKTALFRRSASVCDYPGYYCCPGGHAEPGDLLNVKQLAKSHNISLHDDNRRVLEYATEWYESVSSPFLVGLLFDAAVMEVAEELSVPRAVCRNMGIVSVVKESITKKPDVCFWVDVQLPSSDVQACFNSRHGADAFESVSGSLLFVDLNDLVTEDAVWNLVKNELCGKVTPASIACLLHGVQCFQRRGCDYAVDSCETT